MPGKVRCGECGYLAVRHRATRQLLDAELQLRADGYLLDEDPITRRTVYEPTPICFVQKIDFRTGHGSSQQQEKLKESMQELRDCDGFTEWKQGFTPKEHWEVIHEKQRLEWQANREDADRQFQAEQIARSEQFQTGEAARADERHKENIKLTADLHKKSQFADWMRMAAAAVLGAALATGLPWFVRDKNAPSQPAAKQQQPAPADSKE